MAHRHPRVLIVEDNEDVGQVLAFYIAREGYAVEIASDGDEALRKMRATQPCIVVLDLAMPGMSGSEFRVAQLMDDQLRHVPIIVCSATIDVREEAVRLGAVAVAEKPVDMHSLMATIREHCLK